MPEQKKSDEELAALAQAGEGEAVEELLHRYQNAVRARARNYFLLDGEPEDLVQEGMIGLYSAICAYRPQIGKSFKNFAYLCVTRRIYDALRASGRRGDFDLLEGEVTAEERSPEEVLLSFESREELRGKLSMILSDLEFHIMSMYLDGMSYAEICKATGKSKKSVDNALARSKRKLQASF